LPGDLPVLWIFKLHVLGRLDLRGFGGNLAVSRGTAGRLVRNHALICRTLGSLNTPLLRRCRNQHFTGRSATLANVVVGFAYSTFSAGGKALPNAVTFH